MSEHRMEELVHKTFILSKEYRNHYVQIEHLLAVILDTEEVEDILMDFEVEAKAVSREIYDYLEKEVEAYTNDDCPEPKKTVMLERVFHRAFTQALFNGRQTLDPRDLLISMLSEQNTIAVSILNNYGLTRERLAQYLADTDQKDPRQITFFSRVGYGGRPSFGRLFHSCINAEYCL